ncbi:hypothetical protein JD969_17175 [Planctomycetota bacterium]|nr:hypothetical protein JD969_17175 [Planctomycetota bacterium]
MQTILKNPKLLTLWQDYVTLREQGRKKLANKTLNDFIALLKQQDKQTNTAFVEQLCKIMIGRKHLPTLSFRKSIGYPDDIQHSLFKEIFFPVLVDWYTDSNALHMQWIAQLSRCFNRDWPTAQDFIKAIGITDDEHHYDINYLKKSYQLDPHPDTLNMILIRLAQGVSFDLHHMPEVVLSGPDEYDSWIDKLEHYLQFCEDELEPRWQIDLSTWRNIGKHWRTYFDKRKEYDGFYDYQQKHNLNLDQSFTALNELYKSL